jgi:hypothetical protein
VQQRDDIVDRTIGDQKQSRASTPAEPARRPCWFRLRRARASRFAIHFGPLRQGAVLKRLVASFTPLFSAHEDEERQSR